MLILYRNDHFECPSCEGFIDDPIEDFVVPGTVEVPCVTDCERCYEPFTVTHSGMGVYRLQEGDCT